MTTHRYEPDWTVRLAYRERRPCRRCGLPKQNRVHDVPERAEGDISDRIVGERQEA